ncbi:hypothetical protein SAMN03159341_12836 [Paenibacillus sp. 1_12]|uniref:hypothetical protein n=1 Tax=Paenibacillus sp. 1_12 TaxID=1566278 RepID=UPI0008EACBB7|nr:hypothetical protein [Paenibacillus sp. 1_12]SFM36032.1 hypothetical protein SAMN03159341_12836 [Paenibacillus sp. 1_12]
MGDDDYKKKYKEYKKKYEILVNKQKQQQLQGQAQGQLQGQAQGVTDTDTISNVGNPVINVNVSTSTSDASNLVKASAFKATAIQDVQIPLQTPTKLLFTSEIFDLDNEYDTSTSTFIPKTAGVYVVTASAMYIKNLFSASNESNVILYITVNGQMIDEEDDFRMNFGLSTTGQIVSVNDILNLNAGDRVEVGCFQSIFTDDVGGTVLGRPFATFFTAARVPSSIT